MTAPAASIQNANFSVADSMAKHRLMGATTKTLYRYTTLPVLIDVLARRRVTLLSPESWEDRNDAYGLEHYREQAKLRTLLAVCFSQRAETFHHWSVFSNGSSGVCIQLDKSALLSSIQNQAGFRSGLVHYELASNLQKRSGVDLKDLPFLKHKSFQDEGEFRIIFESAQEDLTEKFIPIDLSWVRKVTLSPWLANSVASSVIEVLKDVAGCSGVLVKRSNLIDNSKWRSAVARTR